MGYFSVQGFSVKTEIGVWFVLHGQQHTGSKKIIIIMRNQTKISQARNKIQL